MAQIVKAKSVKDYLNRYYKKSKMTDTLLQSYEEEYAQNGFVCTSHHDNVTGEFIVWSGNPDNIPIYMKRGKVRKEIVIKEKKKISVRISGEPNKKQGKETP
jgi:hypothetical protein